MDSQCEEEFTYTTSTADISRSGLQHCIEDFFLVVCKDTQDSTDSESSDVESILNSKTMYADSRAFVLNNSSSSLGQLAPQDV